jgi:hypothetical protein
MRSNLRKMRIKRVSSKAPEWQQQRNQDRCTTYNMKTQIFDNLNTHIEEKELDTYFTRRHNRFIRKRQR